MKTLRIAVGISIFAIMLSACAGSSPTGQFDLEGTTWMLATFNQNRPIEDTQPTIKFEDGQVSGNAGCNSYDGNYQVKGDSISFDTLYMTEMGCMEPEGVMNQELTYLELLGAAQRFELVGGVLRIITDSEQTMTFQSHGITDAVTPIQVQPSPIPSIPTAAVLEPTPSLTFKPPVGFKVYQDSVIGVSVYIPENWLVTRDIERQIANFQSYPEDKYVGGEGFEPGDTKCQLIPQGTGTTTQMRLDEYGFNGITTIFSKEEIVLNSGKTATRLEVDIMGELLTLVVAEVNTRTIVLQCFGDRSLFDAIVITLRATE